MYNGGFVNIFLYKRIDNARTNYHHFIEEGIQGKIPKKKQVLEILTKSGFIFTDLAYIPERRKYDRESKLRLRRFFEGHSYIDNWNL